MKTRRKKALFQLVILSVNLLFFSVLFLGIAAYRTRSLYVDIKSSQRGWTGKVYQVDAELGFVPIPGSQGEEVFPIGPEIPARFDRDGFRIPASDPDPSSARSISRPLVLSLGCSFTYGAATRAEETFPYLVGKYLMGTARNGGVASYGLSQMLILARRLVPIYEPDYLIVQYSPWLTARARDPFAPTYFGKLPVPFFYGEGALALHPPVFETALMDLPIDRYRQSPNTMADFASFFWNVGLPLYLHDDFNMALYFGKRMAGVIATPATNDQHIEDFVYSEIGTVARDHGTTVVVAVLGDTEHPVAVKDVFPDDFVVVDAHAALLERLPTVTAELFQQQYAHWRGLPPRVVDAHPNANAHRIIAEAIVEKISSLPHDDRDLGAKTRNRSDGR